MWLVKLLVFDAVLIALWVAVVAYITRNRRLTPPETGWELVECSEYPDEVEVD